MPVNPICATCKHWGTEDYWERDYPRTAQPVRICHKVTDSANQAEPGETVNVMALVQDVDQYGADLVTAETFGCTLWEERGDGGD